MFECRLWSKFSNFENVPTFPREERRVFYDGSRVLLGHFISLCHGLDRESYDPAGLAADLVQAFKS